MHIFNTQGAELDGLLAESGIAQNRGKGEVMPCFVQTGSRQSNQDFFITVCVFNGLAKKVARYLGAWAHVRGTNGTDISEHDDAMRRGWHYMGHFWISSGPRSVKKIVFQAMLSNAAESGLEASVLLDSEIHKLETMRTGFLRVMTIGDGNQATNNHLERLDNNSLRDHWGICSLHSSLRARRLKWLQSVGAHPGANKPWLAVVLGESWYSPRQVTDNGWPIDKCNPWLAQFMADIICLIETLDCANPAQLLNDKGFFVIFTPAFLEADVQTVKTPVALPVIRQSKQNASVPCNMADDYGGLRGFIAKDMAGLQLHRWEFHLQGHVDRSLVPTNICIYFRKIFHTGCQCLRT